MRFILTPPPEEDDVMATRHQPSRTAARIVKTIEEPPEMLRLARSGSEWERPELMKLGVRFSLKKRVDLNKILDKSQWDDETQERRTPHCNPADNYRC